jgi:hypothetical protein
MERKWIFHEGKEKKLNIEKAETPEKAVEEEGKSF